MGSRFVSPARRLLAHGGQRGDLVLLCTYLGGLSGGMGYLSVDRICSLLTEATMVYECK